MYQTDVANRLNITRQKKLELYIIILLKILYQFLIAHVLTEWMFYLQLIESIKLLQGQQLGTIIISGYKTLNVRNGYEWVSGYAVYVKQVSTTEEVLDHIRVYKTW